MQDSYKGSLQSLATPTGSKLAHQLLWASLVLGLVVPPFRHRNTIFAILSTTLFLYANLEPYFTTNIAEAQPFTVEWSNYLSVLEKLLTTESPEASFWRIDRPAQEALQYSAFGYAKVRWALSLLFNMRGIGWNFQVKNIPAPSKDRRWKFCLRQTFATIYWGLVADLIVQLSIRFFYTAPDGTIGTSDNRLLTLRHPDLRWDFAKCLLYGAQPYFFVQMQYNMFSIPAVLLGLNKPEDWPGPFESIAKATTVRNFWGIYWHQTIRRPFNSLTGGLVDLLGIRRGTNASSYTQLWATFFLSGIMHANSMRGLPAPANISTADRTVGMVCFFLLQALAITMEDFVLWLWRSGMAKQEHNLIRKKTTKEQKSAIISGPVPVWVRVVGYMWVTGVMWCAMPLAGDCMLRMRIGQESFLPFTVFGAYMHYIPIPS